MSLDSNTTLATRTVKDIYAVSRLVREARVALEGSFTLIWVEGEISNLAMPASGHVYFTLKDEVAQVRCAMFRNRNRQLRFTPENGMQVLLRVRVTLYEGRGEFQLVVEHMEEAGSGALQRAYEALKHRLGEEGLFDQAHKKPLPLLPKNIGIVSSPDGAAVHDILTVLKRRFSATNVILYPVTVQGADSVTQIAQAITEADQRHECELLIVGRGGGSLEDLWSFNDEQVARAIFDCEIPVISAVGHEVDFTIADFVADMRAPTPSAAAEMAVPDAKEWLTKVHSYGRRLSLLITHYLQNENRHIKYLQQRLPQPQTQISQQMQRLDQLEQQLQRSWLQNLNLKRQQLAYWSVRLKHPQAKIEANQYKLANLNGRLQHSIKQKLDQVFSQCNALNQRLQLISPLPIIKSQHSNVKQLQKQLYNAMQQLLQQQRSNLNQQMRTLAAVSPLSTLERGYSIATTTDSDRVLRNIDDVELGQHINVRLQQGQLACEVKGISK
ncbi:MAG: exodeoxyribonuclease VII large subunit [Gammaproteobacteria bacterium]|nr:MAG: exodeoxyribonuclease VII large subunit [Gammaproteobacteria bacterium]